MSKPRIGLSLPPQLAPDHVAASARWAESCGFDDVWLAEDCFFGGAIATASAALAGTERIRVGIGIMPAVARNAAFTAMELATLAYVYPGRLVAGLGHGITAWVQQVGAAPRSALAALDEHLYAVHALLTGEKVTLSGAYVKLSEVRLEHRPATPPPLLAGVRGPKSLAVAGRRADGVILAWPATPTYIAKACAIATEARRQSGRPGSPYIVACSPISIGSDVSRARERVRPALAAELATPWVSAHLEPLRLTEPVAQLLRSSSSPAEVAQSLPEQWVDELAVVGDPETCAARILQLSAAGAGSVVLSDLSEDRQALVEVLGCVRRSEE